MFIKGYITTHDYGSSDINKRFLGSFIPNNYLVDGNLQIKAGKTRSFPVADLFYFLDSKKLNISLIRYEPNKQERTFKIIEVYFVKQNPHISFCRAGNQAGNFSFSWKTKSAQTHYFIKFKTFKIFKTFLKLKFFFVFPTNNTVGAKSISKQELIFICETLLTV